MKVKVEKLDNLGQGIAHINDKVCFIKNALPDEVVDIKIISDKKKYQKAQIKELIESSKNRKTNICPFSDLCGGCSLGHLKYEKSLEYKRHKLKDIILKSTNQDFEPTIIKSDKEYNYRNKITLKIVNSKWGYYNSESHNFVNINKCLLAKECINKVIEKQNLFDISSGEIVLRANNLNEILISIKTNEEYQISYDELNNLNIVGIVINDETKIGKNYFYHTINNLEYKITYNSFFQINDYICSKIFTILNELDLGKTILDLYCGVGALGLSISKKVNKIYGIEIIENAIIDARHNANINNIKNATYYVGKVEENIKKINDEIDTIIIDPPRKGLNNIQEIININANNLIYISCDPVTLGRDLKALTSFYNIKNVYALDMFPNTYHVESMIVLNFKENNYNLIKAKKENIEQIINYKLKTIVGSADNLTEDETHKINNYVKEKIPKQINNYQMVLKDDTIIGCLCLEQYKDGILLDEIYIEKEYRNLGIGSNILKNIIVKNSIIYLWVYKNNTNAINLYNKLDFQIIDETDTRFFMRYNGVL